MSRFDRQTILPGFGKEGQEKLTRARVLVIGAGGLGCPALLYLAAAGVGTIGIVDGDSISESNLNRQTLFGMGDVGKPKAETAAALLKEKYPDIKFEVFPEYLTTQNALKTINSFDLVLDGTDNFGTRYLVNDACFLQNKPLVMGAIYQFEGQVTVLNYGKEPVNYRDLYPEQPKSNEIPNCSETGVIGVLPGMIGTLQATEAIKVLTGLGEVISNKILYYNLKSGSFFEVEVSPNPAGPNNLPKSEEEFLQKDYEITCGTVQDISWEKALDWKKNMGNTRLVDIREPNEEPVFQHREIEKIPMGELMENPAQLKNTEQVLLFCRSGKRSRKLTEHLKKQFPEKKIFSVVGGILHPSSPLKKENHGS